MSKKNIDKIFKQNMYMPTKVANQHGISNERLTLLEKQGIIERIEHGLYVSSGEAIDMLFAYQYNKRFIYSHETALYLHDLTDRDPLNYSATVYRGYNSKKLKELGFDLYYTKEEWYPLGKTTVETAFGNEVRVYTMERTLCDIVRVKSRMDNSVVISAFQAYTKRKDKDLNKLMEYAKTFKTTKQIRQYLEVLL